MVVDSIGYACFLVVNYGYKYDISTDKKIEIVNLTEKKHLDLVEVYKASSYRKVSKLQDKLYAIMTSSR